MSALKRNVAVFIVAYAAAGGVVWLFELPLAPSILLVALGLAPASFIRALGWLT